MQIFLENPVTKTELEVKSQTIKMKAFFNKIVIQAEQDELVSVSYADVKFDWHGGTYEIPCLVNAENSFLITLELGEKGFIRILVKLDEKQMIHEELLLDYTNFYVAYENWSEGLPQQVDAIIDAVQTGELSLMKMLNPMSGFDEETVLQEIEKTIPFLLEISAKPRMHLIAQEEVLDVSLVKRINASTLQHLSAHSEHWHSRTVTGLRPARLKAEVYEDDFNIYENVFFRMTIEKVQQYLAVKGQQMLSAIAQKEDLADWSSYLAEMNDYRKVEVLKQILPDIDYEENESLKSQYVRVLEQIQALEKQLVIVRSSAFYQKLDRNRTINLPVQPTNILTMDHRYNAVYKLWNTLLKQQRKTPETGIDGKVVHNIDGYYELYTSISLLYAMHLLNYRCIESTVAVNDYSIKLFAKYDTGATYMTVTTIEKNHKKMLQIELVEKLAETLAVPEKIRPQLGLFSDNLHNDALRFHEPLTSDEQKQLLQIVREHMQQLPVKEQREWKSLDSQWRADVTAFLQKFKTPRKQLLSVAPLFQLIGAEENEVVQLTDQLMSSLIGEQQYIACMPYKLKSFQLTNARYWARLQTFGEAFHHEDEAFGQYRTGLFSVSQQDFHSVQRFMKCLFMFEHRLHMEWSLPYTCCPSCQSSNILKTDNHWLCREMTCSLEWGTTKCTDRCGEYFAWMRPTLQRRKAMSSNGYEALKEKELMFGYTVLTDFVSRSQDGVSYVPVCPTCGQ
ncbi:hypothetical protein [Solibacillus isronensis]|uniref:hypothetical protein n=1 Tax=Solibacillus isronensis TaxID=412383 RepID=UPI00203E14E5|nr:hypothetical protein [Solibacillus isronensis]MCM3721193.1 hypothetical protein [Solibacillus isronensis]